jgi:ATP-dependent Clp protease protease subunit
MARKNELKDHSITNELFDMGIDRASRTLILNGEVDEDFLYKAECGITLLESLGDSEITIRLKTQGGDIYYGNAVVDRVLNSTCPIHIHAYGEICSMGIFILASGESRSTSELTCFMHHEDSYAFDSRHSHNKNFVKAMEIMDIKMCKWLATRTKKDFNFWKKTGVDVDHWFTAEQALEYGLIDEIR